MKTWQAYEDEVIQAAYRRLARKYQPDLAKTPEAAAREECAYVGGKHEQ